MRHAVAGYKLSRDAEDRRALRRNLAIALFTHGQITTTRPKAKSVQSFIEKIISAARKGDLASRRRVTSALGRDQIIVKNDRDETVKRNKYGELKGGPRIVKKLFDEIAPQYANKPGGYTRIVKLARHRIGDGSDLVVLQLIPQNETGPTVSGQYSRRRDKANHRMEVAAKLRKSRSESAPAAAETKAEEKAAEGT
ncbi:MAG: 50S ribosomal protein L17 [Phycisphaeraceae bacterium]|nr:50S ribosomal protein L17 [Phycisphaeraceae bacterium]